MTDQMNLANSFSGRTLAPPRTLRELRRYPLNNSIQYPLHGNSSVRTLAP